MSAPAGLRLERADLATTAAALRALQPSTAHEVSAAKAAWPSIAHGVPHTLTPQARAAIAAVRARVRTIERLGRTMALSGLLPRVLQEGGSATLTGPAAQLAGLYRNYLLLAARGWKLIEASVDEIQSGGAGAHFARENIGLYIESVYDAHFTLAQIGKQLQDGYRKLGGARAFGPRLTQADVEALSGAYSEAAVRLHPHVTARLGS
jgi:hypothetical protein